jgi:hypothetical protein
MGEFKSQSLVNMSCFYVSTITASCQNVALCQTSAQFPLCVRPVAFKKKRQNFCPVVRGVWNFILAVRYEIRTRCDHSAYMLCHSFPEKLIKWVFSDAVSCSDDMRIGDLHFRSIGIYGQV